MSIRDRELDEPYLDHGVEIIAPADWDAPLVRCDACGLVEFPAGRRTWDDACGCPHYCHDGDIDPVCVECESEFVTPIPGLGSCQHCFSAAAMPDDDWCYTCAVAQELDDCRVMARTERAVGDDWMQTVREITLAQAVRP